MVVNSALTTLPRAILDSMIPDIRHNLIGIRVRLNVFISFTGYSSTTFMKKSSCAPPCESLNFLKFSTGGST